MRCLQRNKRAFWYCLYEGTIRVIDEYGNETSEQAVTYADAISVSANISAATGYAQTEQFGNLDNYDKVIVTEDTSCPIDENTVLFIDKAPEYTNAVTYVEDSENPGTYVETTISVPAYDYVVRRVARSINSVSIAISKVKVS